MDDKDDNSLAAVKAILADFGLGMQELRKSQVDFRMRMQELHKSQAETDRQMKQSQAAFDVGMQELQASIKQVSRQMGGMANSNGDMAQDYFYNALYNRNTLFGQEFDEVKTEKRKIKKTGVEVQYDVLLVNGKSVCIVEVKYKADTDDVRSIPGIQEKFRQNYPEHDDKKLFLALASMSYNEYVEAECKKLGIAMIKQVGDTIEIYDEHMKVF